MRTLSYKKMVIDSMLPQKPDEKTLHTLDVTEAFIEEAREHHPEHVEEFLIKVSGSINGCHFTEDTACWAVHRMQPVSMTHDAFMDMLKKPKDVETLVRDAYSRARTKGREKGIAAPDIHPDYTPWDMYVTYAMMLADYWLMDPHSETIADMTYCYLSDPDYPRHTKIWDYLMK